MGDEQPWACVALWWGSSHTVPRFCSPGLLRSPSGTCGQAAVHVDLEPGAQAECLQEGHCRSCGLPGVAHGLFWEDFSLGLTHPPWRRAPPSNVPLIPWGVLLPRPITLFLAPESLQVHGSGSWQGQHRLCWGTALLGSGLAAILGVCSCVVLHLGNPFPPRTIDGACLESFAKIPRQNPRVQDHFHQARVFLLYRNFFSSYQLPTILPKATFHRSWITTVKYYSCTAPNLALAC